MSGSDIETVTNTGNHPSCSNCTKTTPSKSKLSSSWNVARSRVTIYEPSPDVIPPLPSAIPSSFFLHPDVSDVQTSTDSNHRNASLVTKRLPIVRRDTSPSDSYCSTHTKRDASAFTLHTNKASLLLSCSNPSLLSIANPSLPLPNRSLSLSNPSLSVTNPRSSISKTSLSFDGGDSSLLKSRNPSHQFHSTFQCCNPSTVRSSNPFKLHSCNPSCGLSSKEYLTSVCSICGSVRNSNALVKSPGKCPFGGSCSFSTDKYKNCAEKSVGSVDLSFVPCSSCNLQSFKMSRPALKKTQSLKMDRSKRPPLYRPKSRTEQSTGSGYRMDNTSRLRGDGGGGGSSDEDLNRLNTDLRQRLHDEASIYRRRLDTYKQSQQNQAVLVSRLQAKVLQYKQRCADLESQMADTSLTQLDIPSLSARGGIMPCGTSSIVPAAAGSSSALEQAQQLLREAREERVTDLDTALRKLEEERRRCDKLMHINNQLREQVEESHQTNEALTGDLQKLTNDWEELREEMLLKEDEWKDEEQAFNDYYSTEHNRLLSLWRDVVSVKRLFMDVQSVTERDLGRLRTEIGGMGRDVAIACTRVEQRVGTTMDGVGFGGTQQYMSSDRKPLDQESLELRAHIELLRSQHETYQTELKEKDERIQSLLRSMQNLEERCSEAEHSVIQVSKLQEEIDVLQDVLRDIAVGLIQDVDAKDHDIQSTSHIHLTASTPLPQRSPKRNVRSITTPAAFADSTKTAVHAALNKYQSVIHELQVKLQSNKEQLTLVRKQFENSDECVNALEAKLKEIVIQLDCSREQCSLLTQERDSLQKNYDTVKADKLNLERHRMEINTMIDALNNDFDKLQRLNNGMQKEIDTLQDEKIFLQSEVDRLNQDASLREMNLHTEEDRCSRIREELLTTKEELNKLYLSHDLLEQQKLEGDSLINSLEKSKADYEQQLDKALGDKSSAGDDITKKDSLINNLEIDKKKLQEEIKKVEEEKQAIQSLSNDQQNDLQSLRKELLQAEQLKLDFESDKVSLGEKVKFLEIEKGKIEMELGQSNREKGDLANSLGILGRKRDTLNEELMRIKQRLEQANETNARVNRNLEELVKECEGKQCTIDAIDKDLQRHSESLASLRAEKDSLEAVLFDAQTSLESCDARNRTLEEDLQRERVLGEGLRGNIARLGKDVERAEKRAQETKNGLLAEAGRQEAEFVRTVDGMRTVNTEQVRVLTEEREKLRVALESRLSQTVAQLTNERDMECSRLNDQIANLQTHIENVCAQHEELMLRAENDKQQALIIAHHDHQALQDRLDEIKRDLEGEKDVLERVRRESNSKFEQDRNNINQLKEELNKNKSKLEENRVKCEDEKAKLDQQMEEIRIDRESAQNEVENLRVQLHLTEDKVDSITNQLHDSIRKLKEAENSSESLRKDLTDVRRQLADSNFEKEKYHGTNKELREFVKRTESEKRDQARQLEESFQKISTLEEIKISFENERTKLQNQLREAEKDQLQLEHKSQSLQEELQRTQSSSSQQQAEEKELQARLLNEVEERERAHQEVHQLKKQISELDRNLEQTRQELGRTRAHGAHHEEQWHAREQDLLVHLEDSRGREKRLEDQKHNLEVCLVDATQQIQELKAKLGGAENRVRALDGQLTQVDTSKRDVEQKLSSVVSTLRRIAGVQLDGSVTMPYRLLSPTRRYSPARSTQEHESRSDLLVDVDPETVRKGVRNLMQQVAQIERERDDFKNQISTTKKQLKEANDSQNKGDSKLNKVLGTLRAVQDEKGTIEAKLGQKNIALQAQIDALHKKTEEVKQMRDKIISLELSISGGNEQKTYYEDKIDKMKSALGKLELDKRNLQEELGRVENRATKLELQRMSAEGDLQRLQMMLQEKDVHIQKLQEKSDGQGRNLASLEERCVQLKTNVDQLNQNIERANGVETELKGEIQNLQRNLLDSNSAGHSGAEKMKHLHKSVANSENERRVISERLDTCQQNLAEMRRNNQILQDQIARLNNELANNEVQRSGLESQLRLAQWPSEQTGLGGHHDDELARQLQASQRERSDLRAKIDTLNGRVRELESDKRDLERNINRRSQSQHRDPNIRPEKHELDSMSHDSNLQHRGESRGLLGDSRGLTAGDSRGLTAGGDSRGLLTGDARGERDSRGTNGTHVTIVKYEQENRELRVKIGRLEAELLERERELARVRSAKGGTTTTGGGGVDRCELERYRAAQLQAERLLDAREQSHRQQVQRLENQVSLLREQLNQEIKRRQQYVMRSTRAGREMAQLRQALGDSLRTVSQDPAVDALLLEHEARKLDNTVSNTVASLPVAGSGVGYERERRSTTPQPYK